MNLVPTAEITVIPFLMALVISLISTPITIWCFSKLGWVVDPKKSPHPAHIHKDPVPKGGGLPVLVSVLITTLCLIELDYHLIAVFVACILTTIVGLVDDIKGVNPYKRLGFNFLAAIIIVASGIGISFVSNPFGGIIDLAALKITLSFIGNIFQIWILADLFALLWIPILMNAINWSSGVDGQISGVITIAAVVLGMISLNYSADITQWPVSTLAFALGGAFLGLTVYHFYPQKIMPGYSATSLAGLLLGVVSILATAKVGALLVVLGVPLIDFVYTMTRRVIAGKSPVWGDKNHLHHKLLNMGWSKKGVALFYWLATGVLGVVALNFEAKIKLLVIMTLVALMAVFSIWQYFYRFSKQRDLGNG